MKKYTAFTLILFLACTLFSQEPWVDFLPEPNIDFNPKSYVCYRAIEEINIDGKIDDESWQNAFWTDYFVDIEGDLKPLPTWKTRVKMLWDDNYFYFAAEMVEPHVWGKLKERDSVIFFDNDFEIFIDPQGDTHLYYEFEMNALNTVWDLLLNKPYRDFGNKAIDSWDIQKLQTAVYVDGTINDPSDQDYGWNVEVAIPWKVLEECADSCPPQQGDQWRVNFSRVNWDTEIIDGKYEKIIGNPEHNWVWSPQGIINMHYPELWGIVQFSEKTSGEKFVYNHIENVKWTMRQIYYKQRTYHMLNGKFANNLDDLKLINLNAEGFNWPPEIYTTPNTFEALLISDDGITKISIFEDGLITVTLPKEEEDE
jgi:Carbohydrate family 9 binding domain-like